MTRERVRKGGKENAVLSVRVQGADAEQGRLPVAELVAILESVEQAIKRSATRVLTGTGWTTDYRQEVEDSCALSVRTDFGSTKVVFYQASRQDRLEGAPADLLEKATVELMKDLASVEDGPSSQPDRYVLESVNRMIERIPARHSVTISSPAYRHAPVVKVSPKTRTRLQEITSEPESRFFQMTGQVTMVSSEPLKFHLVNQSRKIPAKWDERLRPVLFDSARDRRWVRARGIARFRKGESQPFEFIVDHVETVNGPEAAGGPISPRDALLAAGGQWRDILPKEKTAVELTRDIRDHSWG